MAIVFLSCLNIVVEQAVLVLRVCLSGPLLKLKEHEVFKEDVSMNAKSHKEIFNFGLLEIRGHVKLKSEENSCSLILNIEAIVPSAE